MVRDGARGTIFRRKRGEPSVPLYQLVPMVRLSPELEFRETATRTVNAVFADNFTRAFDRAIRTAR